MASIYIKDEPEVWRFKLPPGSATEANTLVWRWLLTNYTSS